MAKKSIFKSLTMGIFIAATLSACGGSTATANHENNTLESADLLEDSFEAYTRWPTRPVTVVVPFAAKDDDADFYARLYAPLLEKALGQPFIVVNVEGANGTLGAAKVSIAHPDGYTLLFYTTYNLFYNILSGQTELSHHDFSLACITILQDDTESAYFFAFPPESDPAILQLFSDAVGELRVSDSFLPREYAMDAIDSLWHIKEESRE